jgi:uncharacterized protein YndB with AHSA1/START domain
MEETAIVIEAGPGDIWAVLADPNTYPEWLVGAKGIRDVDGHWPEPGSTFHHEVGVGPLHLQDSTSVLESDPPQCLVLEARARPTGVARVEFHLLDVPGGTRVVLAEAPCGWPAHWLWTLGGRVVMAPGLRARNEKSLDQLRAYVLAVTATRP